MKIQKPTYEIWEQAPGETGIYQQIERAGRVCYKSEDHQTADSARPFVERMIKSEHYAMLEHATVYLVCQHEELPLYLSNKFSRCNTIDGKDFITTNLRVMAENGTLADLKFLSDYTPCHERRITVHFTTQIAITREYNRHRANSMAEQSTRYCNYSKNKFGQEITINLPTWVAEQGGYNPFSTPAYSESDSSLPSTDCSQSSCVLPTNNSSQDASISPTSNCSQDGSISPTLFPSLCKAVAEERNAAWNKLDYWLFANLAAEYAYMKLIEAGCKPQEARAILPLDCNTELVHTAFVSDWQHFFDLRALGTTGAPHPDAKILALPLYEEFKQRGYLQ